jgi:hypothetical protein
MSAVHQPINDQRALSLYQLYNPAVLADPILSMRVSGLRTLCTGILFSMPGSLPVMRML